MAKTKTEINSIPTFELPNDVNTLIEMLDKVGYYANEEIGYSLMGSIETNMPLLIEGDPGVGKSSLAIAVSQAFNIPLIRIQCYEGISPEAILYDYDYQRQLLVVSAVRDKLNTAMENMTVKKSIEYVTKNVEFYGPEFLLGRPVYTALTTPGRKVLLIDEIDKATEEIEHTLLETLSDFSLTIPEYGTVSCKAEDIPIVILTSNRYRELSAAMKRRCVYLYIKHKTKEEIRDILLMKACNDEAFCERIADYLYQISQLNLEHATSISEGIAWAKFLKSSIGDNLTGDKVKNTIPFTVGFLAKDVNDRKQILSKVFGVSC